ncbi:NAD(P)/FAD-dependent oxidoreductase [Streptomyces sp. NPDC054775]
MDKDGIRPKGRAVVIGASVAGLTIARALRETFARVTVIDRDELPDTAAVRAGVPQSRQVHGLLVRGRQALNELFPGFTTDLVQAGAPLFDVQSDIHWYTDGRPLKPAPSGMMAIGASRSLMEFTLRAQIAELPSVTIRDRTAAIGLSTNADRTKVTGLRVHDLRGSTDSALEADLVVDASGRGTRSAVWLEELGYQRASEEEVHAQVTYVSRLYRREAHHLGGRMGVGVAAYPGQLHSGFALAQEQDQIIVSLGGWGGIQPPLDTAAMAAYADTLATPEIADIIRSAQPLEEAVKMRYPYSVRRHYEQLDAFPDGYLVAGDALCSFNPFFGQGMTVAVLQAQALAELLADGTEQIGSRFFEAAARLIDGPWDLAVGTELRFPHVNGLRTPATEAAAQYGARLRAAAAMDSDLAAAFLRVTNMIDPPGRLASPGVRARVLASRADMLDPATAPRR